MSRLVAAALLVGAVLFACHNFDQDRQDCSNPGGPCARWDAGDAGAADGGDGGSEPVSVCASNEDCQSFSCVSGCCDAPTCSGIAQLALGDAFSCALTTQGKVRCWGGTDFGQTGTVSSLPVLVPTGVAGISNATEIAAGYEFACALLPDQTVSCWGHNDYGQLGRPLDAGASPDPAPVAGLAGVKHISLGDAHACALLGTGAVRCWGRNISGQLGDGTEDDLSIPSRVCSSGAFDAGCGAFFALDVFAGTDLTCARVAGGSAVRVYCWGDNQSDELGPGATGNLRPNPVQISGLPPDVAQISAGLHRTCALADGGVWCWGADGYGITAGQLGRGGDAGTSSRIPMPVCSAWDEDAGCTPLRGVDEIAAGSSFTCARKGEALWCWGDNRSAQLAAAAGDSSAVAIPAIAPSTPGGGPVLQSQVQSVSAGTEHGCARMAGSGAYCWGNDGYGQLGNNNSGSNAAGDPVRPHW